MSPFFSRRAISFMLKYKKASNFTLCYVILHSFLVCLNKKICKMETALKSAMCKFHKISPKLTDKHFKNGIFCLSGNMLCQLEHHHQDLEAYVIFPGYCGLMWILVENNVCHFFSPLSAWNFWRPSLPEKVDHVHW